MHQHFIQLNVRVPMRDGVHLATDIYLPHADGCFPVVLQRLPYYKVNAYNQALLEHGIAFVTQDCRGRYDSEGDFVPFDETADGEDTLAWLKAQPWCNGRIGMYGASYLAGVQLAVGLLGDPALVALNPSFISGDAWKHEFHVDGVFSLALTWSWLCFEVSYRTSLAGVMPRFDVPRLLRHLPILTMDEAFGIPPAKWYREFVRHNTYDSFWHRFNYREDMSTYRTPTLSTGGWYDHYAGEAVAIFQALVHSAPTDELRAAHRLLIGPWTHGINGSSVLGDIDFGPDACAENDHEFRWLTTLLNGGKPEEVLPAPIRVFVMGRNCWRDEYEWPLARTQWMHFYLGTGGCLSVQPPTASAPDHYTYDPNDPTPTLGGNHSVGPYNPGLYEHALPGPIDQRPIEARPDVLTYTSDVLPADLEVTGPVVMTLYAASSAPDTDFVARLTDVYPDGRSINITEGVIRARFRDDVWGTPTLMEPGTVYQFTIDMQVTSNVFKAGHRLRLQITSSNFPLWDRNLNTGHDPATDTEIHIAEQTLYHDPDHPSHLVLPVIPNG